jgi:hypothetical protein
MSGLAVIKPVTVDDDVLDSSTLTENDYPAIANSTAYALGDRVINATLHKVYECVLAYTSAASAVAPQDDPTHWAEVGPTNKWKPFDTSNDTQATFTTAANWVLTPGEVVNSFYVANVEGSSPVVTIIGVDPVEGIIYNESANLRGTIPSADWYDYFFASVVPKTQAVFRNIPPFPSATFTVTAEVASGAGEVGVILPGYYVELGIGVERGVRVGIQDYSRKERTEFGDVVIVPRLYAKRAEFQVFLYDDEIDALYALLVYLRTTPCVWIGTLEYEATQILGYYKDFDILISYPDYGYAICNMTIEGVT